MLLTTNDSFEESQMNDIFFNLEVVWHHDSSVIPSNTTKYSIETRILNNLSSPGIPFVQSKLKIFDVNEIDFGKYTCTVSYSSRTNRFVEKRNNLCPQKRTIELQPDDWKMQAIRFKDVAKQSAQVYIRRIKKPNHSDADLANCRYVVYLILNSVIGLFFFMLARRRRGGYGTQLMEVVRNFLRKIKYSHAQLKYDVFLSYSNVDREWVGMTLLPYLEDHNYKVCFSERDFKYGKNLVNSIASSICKSMTIIALISPEYLHSRWCFDHELMFTKTRILNKDSSRNSLLIVKFRSCELPKVLTREKYLDYTDTYVNPHFFENLCDWLGPPFIGTQ